jgi:hypothetical protein
MFVAGINDAVCLGRLIEFILLSSRYVPKPEHVRSGLRSLLDRLSQAQTWLPWSDWVIQRYRERDVNYYCGLLPDKAEASDWRRRLEAEVARLDAATAEIKASTSAAA